MPSPTSRRPRQIQRRSQSQPRLHQIQDLRLYRRRRAFRHSSGKSQSASRHRPRRRLSRADQTRPERSPPRPESRPRGSLPRRRQQPAKLRWQRRLGRLRQIHLRLVVHFLHSLVHHRYSRRCAGREDHQLDACDVQRRDLAWRLFLQQKIINVDKLPEKIEKEIAKGFENYPPTEKDKNGVRKEHAKQASKNQKSSAP